MCGIVGFAGHRLDERTIQRAVNTLRHRGPDGTGIYLDSENRIGLGHARLSIIDLETGAQPLYSENRDLVLVCNGEIYEFERLRGELQNKGHVFATGSDSEVILHLYEEHGLDFVDHLRGEFAFLLYDKANGILLAVRDRFGIKPLFYNEQNGSFLFASEAKAIFATGQHRPRIDVIAIRDYLSGVIPESVFEGIHAVPPGCLLKVHVTDGTHEVLRYWDLDLPPATDIPESADFSDSVETVGEAVEEAVRLRLRADVPVGVYLSGGIDSATVAALVAKHHTNQLKVFNIAFPDDATYDEFQLSRAMAEKIGAEFHSVSCDRESLLAQHGGVPVGFRVAVPQLPRRRQVHAVPSGGRTRESRADGGGGRRSVSRLHLLPTRQEFHNRANGQSTDRAQTAQGTNRSQDRRDPGLPAGLGVRGHVHPISAARAQPDLRPETAAASQGQPSLDTTHPAGRPETNRRTSLGPPRSSTIASNPSWPTTSCPPWATGRKWRTPSKVVRRSWITCFLRKPGPSPTTTKSMTGIEKQVLREAFKDELTEEIYQRKKWAYAAPPLRIRKGQSPELDRLIDTYLSKAAIKQSGLFNHRAIALLRLLARLVSFNGRTKQTVNTLLVFILTVQILERLYVQEFDANLEKHSR